MAKPKITIPHSKNICGDFRNVMLEVTRYFTRRIEEKTLDVGIVHATDEIHLLADLARVVGHVNELHYDYEKQFKEWFSEIARNSLPNK